MKPETSALIAVAVVLAFANAAGIRVYGPPKPVGIEVKRIATIEVKP